MSFDEFWDALNEEHKQFVAGLVSGTTVVLWILLSVAVCFYIGGVAGVLTFMVFFPVPFSALLYDMATDEPFLKWGPGYGKACKWRTVHVQRFGNDVVLDWRRRVVLEGECR